MSLPRQHRLTDKQAFRELFQNPCVSADPCFKILAKPNDQDFSRLGMAVSRKVDRRAAQRNRIKRIIRESFRLNVARKTSTSVNADYMVLPRTQSVTISNQELFERLDKLWNNVSRKLPAATRPAPTQEQDQEHN